jgi:hypothetical protein
MPPAIVSQVQAESRLASSTSRPSHPSSETDTQTENGNLASNETVPNEITAVGRPSNHNKTLTQTEPAARGIWMTSDNEPSNTKESRGSANLCDGPEKDGKDGTDYGQIVRDLHRLKQERKPQAQKIEAGDNSLPGVSILTQSASDARRAADGVQCAADGAQRIADEAQRSKLTAISDEDMHGALTSEEASIPTRVWTEHCGLKACPFKKKLADSMTYEGGHDDQTVLHVLMHCDLYAEVRRLSQGAAGAR